ncbi:hypothetical protein AXG93_2931s1190 [Marchantia polymorpha subsp. ruderalis]|uniref:Uncharacterized protein n=1 Tax=Marchantia polymorpha subsp. ruderalis TaxID=1480154 RepID=A0A176VVU2_MARPO|nr:hypothetical protein AXG93_2931s1190 [Marchantia polymorpha subsp. ruderalis]
MPIKTGFTIVINGMANAIDQDDKYENVTMNQDLHNAILDVAKWKRMGAVLLLLQPLCAALAHLEGIGLSDEISGLEIEKEEDNLNGEQADIDEIRLVNDLCTNLD